MGQNSAKITVAAQPPLVVFCPIKTAGCNNPLIDHHRLTLVGTQDFRRARIL